jgi:hypothetical protein
MRLRTVSCALTLAFCLLNGCHRNISGSYLASDSGAVCWLQMVRTPDNHLTGQLATSFLKPDGHIEQTNATVNGAIDGENVTISGSGFLGLSEFTLSGTQDRNTLTLTGAQPIPISFRRSTVAEFQSAESALNTRSQAILKAKADADAQQKMFEEQENFVATIEGLIAKMGRFDSEADLHLGRFPNAEKSYQAITAKMQTYIAKDRQLAGDPNASNQRAQISNALNQGTNLTEQMHNQGMSLEWSLEGNIKPNAEQSISLLKQCRSFVPSKTNLTETEVQNITSACSRLESAYVPFREKYDAMVNGLAHLEQVYQQERGVQEQLVQESSRLN